MEGIHIRSFVLLISIVVFSLGGCSNNTGDNIRIQNNTNEDSALVKELLADNGHVNKAVVLLNDKELLTAVRMNTFSRFTKRSIGRELEKKLKTSYPDLAITVSVDNKILVEAKKLLNEKDENKVAKKIKKLKSLIKEET